MSHENTTSMSRTRSYPCMLMALLACMQPFAAGAVGMRVEGGLETELVLPVPKENVGVYMSVRVELPRELPNGTVLSFQADDGRIIGSVVKYAGDNQVDAGAAYHLFRIERRLATRPERGPRIVKLTVRLRGLRDEVDDVVVEGDVHVLADMHPGLR